MSDDNHSTSFGEPLATLLTLVVAYIGAVPGESAPSIFQLGVGQKHKRKQRKRAGPTKAS